VGRLVLAICAISSMAALALAFAARASYSTPGNLITRVGVRGTAFFEGNDLICVNEPASGSPRFRKPGVACSSSGQPYKGIGVWITKSSVVITSPPNGRVLKSYKR
jgi:hypothetical protein